MEGIPYEKLVRDEIPAKLDALGEEYEQRTASEEEFKAELNKKLQEEIREFIEAKDPVKQCEELADILEVVDALKTLPEYADVLEVQRNKREKMGGFDQRLIVKGFKPKE